MDVSSPTLQSVRSHLLNPVRWTDTRQYDDSPVEKEEAAALEVAPVVDAKESNSHRKSSWSDWELKPQPKNMTEVPLQSSGKKKKKGGS